MSPESIKYLEKRRNIIKIISRISVEYESESVFIAIKPNLTESCKAAEKILSGFGMTKPMEVIKEEVSGAILYSK